MVLDSTLRDDPKFAGTIFGGRAKELLNERGEGNISDSTFMALNERDICVEALKVVRTEHSDG